jgi:exopolysaccharide biosynthesis polyprenyl glycosylphosphotransferase
MQLFGNRPRRYEAPIGRVSSSLLQWFGAALVGIVALTLYGAIDLESRTSSADVALVFVLLFAITAARETSRWLASPVSRLILVVAVPSLLLAAVVQAQHLAGAGSVHVLPVALATAVAAAVLVLSSVLSRLSHGGLAPTRIAVIGSERSAESLRRELALAHVRTYTVVGWVSPYRGDAGGARRRDQGDLGPLNALAAIVRQNGVDLLLMTGEASRQDVFDEVAASCLHLPVRFCELSSFHEDLFGHVTVTEINTAWFQYIMHPRYRAGISAAKRAFDLAGSVAMGLVFLPFLALFAVLIKLDGGSVFFGQTRIGEGGRPFTLWKLRTMRAQAPDARWTAADDDRITWVGRLLRRTHVDELPQLLNVMRGQMSLVGPRPEQPEFVERLERAVPFYTRRHLIKPGLTGWAQVRCGYEGSDEGSLWKVSHDLYYLKHRSMALDFAIVWETVLTLLRPKPHNVDAETVGWLFDEPGATPPPGLPNVAPPRDLAVAGAEAPGS